MKRLILLFTIPAAALLLMRALGPESKPAFSQKKYSDTKTQPETQIESTDAVDQVIQNQETDSKETLNVSKKTIQRLVLLSKNSMTYRRHVELDKVKNLALKDRQFLNELFQILKTSKQFLTLYPKKQAVLRVQALNVLENLPPSITHDEVQNLILELSSKISSQGDHKGMTLDLTDLIAIYLKSYTKDELLTRPELVFEKLPYQPRFKKFYTLAIFYRFPEFKADTLHPKFERLKNYLKG